MKRQKRDKTNRIFMRGHHAGIHRRSREECPYTNPADKQTWLNGWREGREHLWEGKTGVASIQYLSKQVANE